MTLQEYIKQYGVKKTHIARELCVSAVSVDNWAKGINTPTPDKIAAIRDMTDGRVDLDDWVTKPDGAEQ